MDIIATVSVPILALLFSGYGAKQLGLLDEASIAGLNGFVYYFALPALFVIKVAETSVVRLFDWRLVAAYHGAGLGVFGVAMLCGRLLFGHRLAVLGLQGLAVAWGNVGYMGPPLVLAAFGDGAMLPAAMILAFDIIIPVSLAIAIVEGGLGSRQRWFQVGQTVLGGLARNPLMLAVLAGAFLSVVGLTLPAPAKAIGVLLGAPRSPARYSPWAPLWSGTRSPRGRVRWRSSWASSCWRIHWPCGCWSRMRSHCSHFGRRWR